MTIQTIIEQRIADIQTTSATQVAQLQADLTNLQATQPAVLALEIDAATALYQALKPYVGEQA